MPLAKKIMFLGTGSDVGKSVAVTAFCRLLRRRGFKVAPFKAQNMSNNSYVTLDNGELGRSQAAQAEAAGILPTVHMNPVLLKPAGEKGAQVVVQGRVWGNMRSEEYYRRLPEITKLVRESYRALAEEYDAIVLEGAGSCAEVNLRRSDIVNFEMALAVNAPVVLVADIDRGGVFAQLVGTLKVIAAAERALVEGFLINKFRGDAALFADGLKIIKELTGRPVWGLVPHLPALKLDTEDSMSLETRLKHRPLTTDKVNIAVLFLPHLSNFTDVEALEADPRVTLNWLSQPEELTPYDLVILPGTKSTMSDAKWLKDTGWFTALRDFAAQGGRLAGLCGGYQLLGRAIADPHGIEGFALEAEGLGLLDVTTEIAAAKIVRLTRGRDLVFFEAVEGYEIHMGRTILGPEAKPFLQLETTPDGAISKLGKIWGTYLHGIFDQAGFRRRFLESILTAKGAPIPTVADDDFRAAKEKNYELLATHFEKYCDVEGMIRLMR